MKIELSQILNKAQERLVDEIDPDNGLFSHLLSMDVLTDRQIQACKAKSTPPDKVEEILKLLKTRPDEHFLGFCGALDKIGRTDIAAELRRQAKALSETPSDSSAVAATSTPADAPAEAPGAIKVTPTTQEFYSEHHQHAYPMNKVVRGHACIISVFKTRNYEDRHGTEKDRQRLKDLFKQLNFEVHAYKDEHGLKAQDIIDKIKLTAAMDVATCPPQCYVLIILCHGEMDKETRKEFVLGTDGERLSKQTILDALVAEENLHDTPCLVFFVCCRDEVDIRHDGVSVNQDRHFFVAFPRKEASSSYRHEVEGTCYARSLVKVMTEFAHNTELTKLIEKVKIEVQTLMKVQIADVPVSTLERDKKFYFFPGITV